MTNPFDQATNLLGAHCQLVTRLMRAAEAIGVDMVEAGARSARCLDARKALPVLKATEVVQPEQQADVAKEFSWAMSENLEEIGCAFAEWQSSCMGALTGAPASHPGDFLRFNAWAWRKAGEAGPAGGAIAV